MTGGPTHFFCKDTTMNLEECTQAIRTKVGADSGLAATLKFDCGTDGVIRIDGAATPNSVSNDNADSDCTVGITLENLNALLTGDLEPTTGFMAGKLKVSGDMGVAMRLQRVI
jgi:putative sterol carrier protein